MNALWGLRGRSLSALIVVSVLVAVPSTVSALDGGPPTPTFTLYLDNALTAPTGNLSLNGGQTVNVTVTSSNHRVWIEGTANLQLTGIWWRLWIDVYGYDLLAYDNADNQTVTLDGDGFWEHKANGSGSLTGAQALGQGSYSARAYSSLSYAPSRHVEKETSFNFSVVQ